MCCRQVLYDWKCRVHSLSRVLGDTATGETSIGSCLCNVGYTGTLLHSSCGCAPHSDPTPVSPARTACPAPAAAPALSASSRPWVEARLSLISCIALLTPEEDNNLFPYSSSGSVSSPLPSTISSPPFCPAMALRAIMDRVHLCDLVYHQLILTRIAPPPPLPYLCGCVDSPRV